MAIQVSVIGSGAEHEENAETVGRPVVVLEPGWEVDGTHRARTPAEAVEFALAAARDTGTT